jgi:predicted pyridoxine 5'-phosphate oxidase superfamily flavin-nucleotide-binding protein
MAKMTKEVMDMMNDAKASKVLATCDAKSKLNVVSKGTLAAIDEETIAFADIFGGKTNSNITANQNAAVSVFKVELPPVGYQVKGTFQGFQTSGPLFDTFAQKVKELLNLNIKSVGTIKVNEVFFAGVPTPGAKIA